MSGTVPQSRASGGLLVWRALQTPVRDLLHGRINPRVGVEGIVSAAGLPTPLAELVRRVVRRTRLWRDEQVEVARELASHFQDGLAARVSAEELAASFGDPLQAAELIRRAKRRNRPLAWKAMKLTERVMGALVLLVLVVYAVQAMRVFGGAPKLARNFAAEWNAAALAVPEAERAWPLYRAAELKITCTTCGQNDWCCYYTGRPGAKDWPEVVAWLEANREAIELYRRAASMPKLGWFLTCTSLEEPVGFLDYCPPLIALGKGSHILIADAYWAAEAADGARIVENVRAILRMAEHARELRMGDGGCLAFSIVGKGCDLLGTLLRDRPTLLNDGELATLAHCLASVGDGTLHVRLDFERVVFEDMLQRCYTDNGRGEGMPQPKLLAEWLDEWLFPALGHQYGSALASAGWWPWARTGVMPAFSIVMAGRRELLAKFHYFMDRYEAEIRVPLWERHDRGVVAEIAALEESRWNRLRYAPLVETMPLLVCCMRWGDLGEQQRDATLVAIAMELYRRRHGTWPASLNDLTPQWLPKVPLDCYDGKPLRYRLANGQPLVYSVGVDRDDDGGRLPDVDDLRRDARRWANDTAAGRRGGLFGDAPRDGDWILWPPVSD